MKKTIIAAALLAATGVVHSASLTWDELATDTTTHSFNIAGLNNYSGAISIGGLLATSGKVTYTFLGKEAGYTNELFAPTSEFQFNNNTAIGTSFTTSFFTSAPSGYEYLDFKFVGQSPIEVVNGTYSSSGSASIGLIAQNSFTYTSGTKIGQTESFQYIIGYNDSYDGHADWDDMVIGVNIAPIPEPETYAMLLAGLGLMGFVARRRKQRAA